MKTTPARGLALSAVTALAVAAVSSIAVPASAAPGTLSLVATSDDGAAFDRDEHGTGDITVQVTDSIAGPVDADDAQDLVYSWTITPFDTTVPPVRVPAADDDVQVTEAVGEFVVPLPSGQPSGTYVLTAGLTPDAANAVAARQVLTVKAGDATIGWDDASPLRVAAGTDRTLAGDLRLEDGTGLPGRLVDLDLARGSAGSDPGSDAGFVPDPPDTALVTTRQVTTATDGSFVAVLSDPAEDPQGTELGGSLQASNAAVAGASLDVDFVSEQPPAGSTVEVTDPGAARPGEALGGTVTATAPDDTFDTDPAPGFQGDADADRDPVEGQQYTLTLDHGFFTTGDERPGAVVDAPAGNLVDLGDTLTGLTDADGQMTFQVAIERDTGFDDDGLVTATVDAAAGDVSGQETAEWDSSDPLNGDVEIVLSPAGEQVGPVDPALAGNRVYHDVVAVDQFGNRAGTKPVDLTYSGNLDDYDISNGDPGFAESDFDDNGDIWVVSFEAGEVTTTGTWVAAPTFLYTDTAGNAAPGLADASGSTDTAFYELDFDRSRFSISSSSRAPLAVGTAATHTVTVRDQQGNPVGGYTVRFFRFGPEPTGGAVQATRVTNADGRASFTFVGPRAGRARVTAEVTDGIDIRRLVSASEFRLPVTARLRGRGQDGAADQFVARAPAAAAGARLSVFRVAGTRRIRVRAARLDRSGTVRFQVRDRNGRRPTTYVAVVRATRTTFGDTTNTVRVR